MRVLVTGASGGLGRYVTRELSARGHVTVAPSHAELDVTDADDIRAFLTCAKLSAVVHLAALADVDRCADRPDEAALTNALATYYLVDACEPLGLRVVYMSTNDVFSECRQSGPFSESCSPAPGMAYSWSKYLGEVAVVKSGGLAMRANFFTLRCRSKRSFVAYVVSQAQAGLRFCCYTNVRAAPVHASTLAERMVDALSSGTTGVLHVASSGGGVSRDEQARLICNAYGLSADGIIPAPLEDRRGRPLDARLTSERGGVVGGIEEEIKKLVREEPL